MVRNIAIVTGASSGIGLVIAKTLLERGYSVVATSRTVSKHPALADTSRYVAVDGDVGDEGTASRVVETAMTRFGKLDLLVNNAGIFIPKRFTDYDQDDYARLISTNLAGFFHMAQHALRRMEPRQSGHIVNLGTSLANQPQASVPSALPILIKGGIEAATRSLAIEYAALHIRINTIAVGIVDTPMHSTQNHDFLRRLSPANRIATPNEIAEAVLYLDAARFVSGEVLRVDGGAHAGKWN